MENTIKERENNIGVFDNPKDAKKEKKEIEKEKKKVKKRIYELSQMTYETLIAKISEHSIKLNPSEKKFKMEYDRIVIHTIHDLFNFFLLFSYKWYDFHL